MRIVVNKHIDLSNYEEKELKINTNNGGSLIIQCVNPDGTLTVEGKNASSLENTNLYGVSNAFDIVANISEAGIYTYDVSGIDNVELNYNGNNGDLYIKVVD